MWASQDVLLAGVRHSQHKGLQVIASSQHRRQGAPQSVRDLVSVRQTVVAGCGVVVWSGHRPVCTVLAANQQPCPWVVNVKVGCFVCVPPRDDPAYPGVMGQFVCVPLDPRLPRGGGSLCVCTPLTPAYPGVVGHFVCVPLDPRLIWGGGSFCVCTPFMRSPLLPSHDYLDS